MYFIATYEIDEESLHTDTKVFTKVAIISKNIPDYHTPATLTLLV